MNDKTAFFKLKELAYLFISALILMIPAFYNGYPIVAGDTGAYVNNAFELYVPPDRAIGYSLFIRITTWEETLWFAIAFQALILSFLIRLLCRHYLKEAYRNSLFLVISLLLTFTTSCAWFGCQLMPDIFTGILLLAILVWYVIPFNASWQKWILGLFILCTLMQHNSNVLILFIFSLVAIITTWRSNKIWLRKSSVLFLICILSLLSYSTMNAISGKGFRPSQSAGVFLMCRLIENGTMDKFLAENCGSNEYNLCPYKDELPNHQWIFMWDQNSPLYKTGGWEANEENYKAIEWKIFTTPRYLTLFLFKSAQATMRQLLQIHVADGNMPMGPGSSPYKFIKERYPYEHKEYSVSVQNDGRIPFALINATIFITTLVLAVWILILAAIKGGIQRRWISAFCIIGLYLVCNAVVTATFSTVMNRFEARVFWVLPFFCILYLMTLLPSKRKLQTSII